MTTSKYTFIFFLCYLYFIPNIFSQEIKTYKGNYKNGNVEYEYYENENFERIKNGNYKYLKKIDEDKSGKYFILFTENGFFKNGKKNGDWIFKIETTNGLNRKLNLNINGNYSDDLKSGSWKENGNKNELNLTFLNDTIVGKFIINGNCGASGNYDGLKCNIAGNFDNNGNWDGEFKLVEPDREIIAVFKNNYLINLTDKKISTGEIFSKYSLKVELTDFEENIKDYQSISFPYNDYSRGDSKEIFNYSIGFDSLTDKQKDYVLQTDYSLFYFMESLYQNYWPTKDLRIEYYYQELNKKIYMKNPKILINK